MTGGIFGPGDFEDDGAPSGGDDADAGFGAVPPVDDGSVDAHCAGYKLTDLGNADRLMARHGEDLLYIKGGGWAAWDGLRWSIEDGPDLARGMAQKTARAIYGEAGALGRDRDAVRRHMKHADASSQSGAISNMLRELQPAVTVMLDEVDPLSAKHLITCLSGTLELGRRVRLRAPERRDRITRLAEVAYDADAECPVFDEFLATIQPDREMRRFLQTYFGYSITAETSEQVMVCLQGNGSNGKSTLIRCVQAAIGDYHGNLPVESLLEDKFRSGGGPSPDIARLPGTRLVTASEPEKSAALSEGRIKHLTGGEEMPARHLNQGFFDFTPQFKITLSYNDPPRVAGTDDGIWRRILVVPFKEKVGPEDAGPLFDALDAELPGIFNWLVAGAQMWFENGLMVPETVSSATRDYRSDSDPVGSFIDECTRPRKSAWIKSKDLHAAYKAWCGSVDLEPVSITRFGRILKGRVEHYRSGAQFYGQFELTEDARALVEGSVGSGGLDGPPRDDAPPAEPDR